MSTQDIKIFVSHRIDLNSVLIDNPIYVPVRCGAIFDKENLRGILGDDTGENISEKRMTYCEFTVQYWAWKNVEADYYGLCHYRRYLSFADKKYRTNSQTMVSVPILTKHQMKRFGLLDEKKMRKAIGSADVVVSEYGPVSRLHSPLGNKTVQSVREIWEDHDGIFFEKSSIDKMFTLIDEMKPEYSESAREYFSGNLHRGYNCYVMRKELFFRLCEFQFPILEALEKQLDTTGYTATMLRTPGFIGEMLYGIFVYHITNKEHRNVKEVQMVFFHNSNPVKNVLDWLKSYAAYYGCDIWGLLRKLSYPLLPVNSNRRRFVKKCFFTCINFIKQKNKQ